MSWTQRGKGIHPLEVGYFRFSNVIKMIFKKHQIQNKSSFPHTMTATLTYGLRWQFLRSSKHRFSISSLQRVFPIKWKLIPLFVYFEDWLQSLISVLSCRSHVDAAAQKVPSQHNTPLRFGVHPSYQIWAQHSNEVSVWTNLSIVAACPCKLIPNAFLLLITSWHLLPHSLFHIFFII